MPSVYLIITFFIRLDIPFLVPQIKYDETHPIWKDKSCLLFKDNNVLQEGLSQALILTNTVCVPDLPSSIWTSLPKLPEYVDDIVKRYVKY